MKISLIIPMFNEEKYIGKCLDSVLQQTRLPDEVVIIDNASTDNSLKIVKNYLKLLPIKFVSEKRKGIRFAVTSGFKASIGDLILRTDADCLLPPTWVSNITNHFLCDPKLAACGGLFKAADGPILAKLFTPIAPAINLIPMALNNGFITFYGANFAIRATVLRRLDFDAIIHSLQIDDVTLSSLLHQHGYTCRYFFNIWCYTSTRRFKDLRSIVRNFLSNFNPSFYHEKST